MSNMIGLLIGLAILAHAAVAAFPTGYEMVNQGMWIWRMDRRTGQICTFLTLKEGLQQLGCTELAD